MQRIQYDHIIEGNAKTQLIFLYIKAFQRYGKYYIVIIDHIISM